MGEIEQVIKYPVALKYDENGTGWNKCTQQTLSPLQGK